MWRISFCIPTLFIGLFVGCGSEPERLAVTGTVRLNGKAISNCTLVLQPLGAEGVPIGAVALVSDGKFEISKSNGLFPGEYGVVFTEVQPDLEDYEAARITGSKNALNKKFIPAKYAVANELRVKIAADMQAISLELKSK